MISFVLFSRSAYKKIVNSFFFIFIVGVSLFLPVLDVALPEKLLGILFAWGLGIYLYFKNFALFVPALFFIINTVLAPVSLAVMQSYAIHTPQLYFLLSIIVYVAIVLKVNKFREEITWFKPGSFDQKTVVWILLMTILTGLALFLWAKFIKRDLSEYQKFIPNLSPAFLFVYGIAFAILNSLFEEFMARAVLFDGFLKIDQNIVFVILAQAVVFALWHFNGFPGGLVGIVLVFIWSLFLGIIRYRANGMLPPLLAHFLADFSIAVILFSL